MKRLSLFALVLLTLLLITVRSFAFSVPPNTGFITDTSNTLSSTEKLAIEKKLEGYEAGSKNEIGVLILLSLDGESIEDVAYQVFNKWGVGKKGMDNGVLLVIALGDHKSRIETGKGAGELTDLQSNDILKSIRPSLHKGDIAGGVNNAVDQINYLLDNHKGVHTSASNSNSSCSVANPGKPQKRNWMPATIALTFITIYWGVRFLFRRKQMLIYGFCARCNYGMIRTEYKEMEALCKLRNPRYKSKGIAYCIPCFHIVYPILYLNEEGHNQ